MQLTLSVLRCPEGAMPETRRIGGGDLCIGRGAGCDWILADPERVLSKRHCMVEFRDGFWQVHDISTNGTFLNHRAEPIGRDRPARLADGDRLRLGAWEIEVRIAAEPPAFARSDALPDKPAGPSFAPFGQVLPDAFDPFTPQAPMPDHRPAASDAFRPPAAHGVAVIPDDWDLDASGISARAAASPVRPAPPQPAPPQEDPLAAFLAGAGLPPGALSGVESDRVLRQAGMLLRTAVAGLRALLVARADIKREFRIEQTLLRNAGNNALKFAATDEAALCGLLSGAGPDDLRETVRDLTAHQIATLAAMQAGARALLEKLSPAAISAGDSGPGLLPGSQEKRLWDAYRTLHRKLSDQFDDDFDSAFGKEFARAYERAAKKNA